MPAETHPLQKTFRPGDTSELRNKDGRCRNCDRARGDGEQFRVCKGCKIALYCSEECQRVQWPAHKSMCKFNRASEERLASLPPELQSSVGDFIKQMRSLLRDFTEAHRPAFQGILQAKVAMSGGPNKFLAEPKVCIVPLKLREPEADPTTVNPALSFAYTNMLFLPLDRVLSDTSPDHRQHQLIKEGWEATTAIRERAFETMSQQPDFVDLVVVIFSMQQVPVTQIAYFPVYQDIPLSFGTAKDALEAHAKCIDLGILFRERKEGAGPEPGILKQVGRKWDWRPLDDACNSGPDWSYGKNMKEQMEVLKRKLAAAQKSA